MISKGVFLGGEVEGKGEGRVGQGNWLGGGQCSVEDRGMGKEVSKEDVGGVLWAGSVSTGKGGEAK